MKNLRETAYGWQKYTKVRGHLVTEHTKTKPEPGEVRTWVHLQHAKTTHTLEVPAETPAGHAFDDDAPIYLDSVAAMPSYADRELHIREWAHVFRGRHRDSVKPVEIRSQLEKLRKDGYAPSSCNKRRTALMHFYTVMNLKSGYNPVRDVPKYAEDEEPRDQSLWTLYRILALMPPSQTRARLRVMVWTGWPHMQLKKLKPAHLDLKNARAFVTPRRKGKGTKGTWLPLLPGAVIALKDFIKWDCFTPTDPKTGKSKPFSTSAMHSMFARYLEKFNARRARFGHPPIDAHPYDFRHSFGTWVAENNTDERALQALMMHSSGSQSRRYTERATERRVASAVASLSNVRKSA